MRTIALFPAAALFFALSPLGAKLGPVPSALLLVALGLLLAAASSAPSALSLTGGALGAFAFGLLTPLSPALAGSALTALAFAERTSRVRRRSARALHLGLALGGGALAGAASAHFAASPLSLRAVAVLVSTVLVALPLLVDADDPLAHALDGAADEIQGPAQASLRAGAELRRSIDGQPLDRRTEAQVEGAWATLLRLAETRVKLERSKLTPSQRRAPSDKGKATPAEAVSALVDTRIADHVAALTRAYLAVDAARAAELSLDDGALRRTDAMGESLEQVSKAIVEEM